MIPQSILFFADRLPPMIGGMEMHARYFIEYFTHHPKFPLSGVISKNTVGQDILVKDTGTTCIKMRNLPDLFNPTFIFFNSGRWIEELILIRNLFPNAYFLYRTGGNEILKAPLNYHKIPDHSLRQSYWTEMINRSIDLLITNSAYTENRLCEIGISCSFIRCVGGVNTTALKQSSLPLQFPVTIFCAARFVPYKNHLLLISIVRELILRGYNLRVRLAGDGPLLAQAKEQVLGEGLNSIVEFLGIMSNEETCQEIARAHIYMQLSTDQLTEVPGGSYVHAEGMGRSILEALSAGTFVIACRSGALPEIVTEERGLLIALDHVEKMTGAVERILKDLPGKRSFSEEFSWKIIFAQYENILDGIR